MDIILTSTMFKTE
jgi:Ran-binding protein 1